MKSCGKYCWWHIYFPLFDKMFVCFHNQHCGWQFHIRCKITLFLAWTLAPAFTSSLTDWQKPCQDTSWRAVLPSCQDKRQKATFTTAWLMCFTLFQHKTSVRETSWRITVLLWWDSINTTESSHSKHPLCCFVQVTQTLQKCFTKRLPETRGNMPFEHQQHFKKEASKKTGKNFHKDYI